MTEPRPQSHKTSDPMAEAILRRVRDMAASAGHRGGAGQDAVDAAIEHAVMRGWLLLPANVYGVIENVLVRPRSLYTDLLSIPEWGDFAVTRVEGGPPPGRPRRRGRIRWHYRVPPSVAVTWLLSDADDDLALIEWTQRPTTEA